MTTEYPKIQTVFKRNPTTRYKTLIEGDYSLPELEYLKDNQWIFTEKVDGTNIRVIWDYEARNAINFKGKTDRAQIPPFLLEALEELFSSRIGFLENIFGPQPACLYGEGYGPKIQKGGGNYRDTPGFVLFDIKIGPWWLKREDVVDTALKLDLDVVPIIKLGTLDEMIKICKEGFESTWGDFEAEGIVATPKVPLYTRRGDRVICKLKISDFRYNTSKQ